VGLERVTSQTPMVANGLTTVSLYGTIDRAWDGALAGALNPS